MRSKVCTLLLLVAVYVCPLAVSEESGARALQSHLDNLASYTLPAAAWSDRHSDIGVTWPREGERGVQQLTTFVGWWGASITEHLLDWRVQENGRPLDVQFRSRNFRFKFKKCSRA